MFRNLIPLLADSFHVVAADLPGFGFGMHRAVRGANTASTTSRKVIKASPTRSA
jgi:hypothetical protein